MKMTKGATKGVLLACILTVPFLFVTAQAAQATGETVTAAPGETIQYSVAISENVTIAGYKFYLDYDTSVFSAVPSGEDGSCEVEKGSFTTKGTILASATTAGCQVLWYNTSNVTSAGGLFTVSLKVANNAAAGTYPITVRCSAPDTINADGTQVAVTCASGAITISDQTAAAVTVSAATVLCGDTVSVPVMLQTNPGIAGFTLQITAGDGLTLTRVSKGALLTASETGSLTVNLGTGVINWTATENVTQTGQLLLLEFSTQKTCQPGNYSISLALAEGKAKNFINENLTAVTVGFTAGTVTVIDYIVGDIDDDTNITSADAVALAKHIVKQEVLTGKAIRAADIDEDGDITAADCVKLARYLVKLITTLE